MDATREITKDKNIFIFNKLVRDKIPEMMQGLGAELVTKDLSVDEYLEQLNHKLIEETQEVIQADSREELIEELADAFEVLYCLAKANNVTLTEIEIVRINKVQAKGSFEQARFIDKILIEDDFKFIDYYRSKPNEYPEIK
ncbi:MAG: nucleoside triphosphate pyrophosphohydrolase [Sphingobacteriia bacterium]|nr:nucleoside triphosphate pyrophosphohydrolase [Sphingobacteriia bacterium]